MKIKLYKEIKELLNYYEYFPFNGKITDDDIRQVFNGNVQISDECRELTENFLNSDDIDKTFEDYISEEYLHMKPEEVTENVLEFVRNGIYDERIISSVKNVSSLLDNFDKLEPKERTELISLIKTDDIIKYLNENGTQKEIILELYRMIDSDKFIINNLENLNSDSDKAKILLYSNTNKIKMLSLIENQYYRNLVIKQESEFGFETKDLIKSIAEYEIVKKQFDELETEEEKAEFVTTLDDYDMRLDFLNQIKAKENRNIVINSFHATIDPKLKGQVDLVQTMIKEYFEDTLGDRLDDSKRERLEIIFRKTDVTFDQLENSINGQANFIFDNIKISNRHKNNINKTLGFIAHEYQHLLSRFDYKTTKSFTSKVMDEGMGDTFADLVINHYLKKHGEIRIDGKKVRVESPYQAFSGYNFENGWPRTILYGLSKSGKDIDALAEYTLGDKRKFAEMVFGEENVSKRHVDQFGIPNIDTNLKELYDSPQMNFSDIDFNSIYAKRNFILPLYELQNRLNSKGIDIDIIDTGKHSYYANYIGNRYFDNRKLYEISREEMKEFKDLLIAQTNPRGNSNIINYDEFYNNKIDVLSEDEIKNYSFEILDTSLALWSDLRSAGTNIEEVLGIAFKKEIDLVQNGQPLGESLRKYKRIIPDYLNLIDPKINASNMFIYDFINDLKFAYLEQIKDNIENGKVQDVIEALKDKEDSRIYIDSDIGEILEDYNIFVKSKENLFSQEEVSKGVIKLYSIELVDEASKKVSVDRNRTIESNKGENPHNYI